PQGPGTPLYRSTDGNATIPVGPGDFQQAISSVGLSFHAAPSRSRDSNPPAPPQPREYIGVDSPDDTTPLSYQTPDNFNDQESYFSPTETNETDITPLTDRRYLQPISGGSTSHGQR